MTCTPDMTPYRAQLDVDVSKKKPKENKHLIRALTTFKLKEEVTSLSKS